MKYKYITILMVAVSLWMSCSTSPSPEATTLKDAYKDKFYIGTALNVNQLMGGDAKAMDVVKNNFNAIVAENCMKGEEMRPADGVFFWDEADKFVEFGEANNMFITGHTLIWHSQAPKWFFTDAEGNDVSREVLIERMRTHIHTVVTRYKGRVKGWDVVNEAIEDDGSFRKSKYYQIVGEDFIKLAFQFAHEADPDAELYYNDYSMDKEGKRSGVVRLVKSLQADGIRIDGVGMQGHLGLNHPDINAFEKSLQAYAALGMKVMITELDISVLPSPWENTGAEISKRFEYREAVDPYKNGMTAEVEKKLADRYIQFFKLFNKYSDNITRVTLWGVTDGDSWRNGWPIPGRTDYALLFGRDYQAKPFVKDLIEMAK
ncbi:MAG: endo-1,4-beta-xylanase [Bacteroidales bacterium]